MAISDQQLEQILEESQLLGEDQLKKSLELSRSRNIPLWEAVVSLDLISDAQMGKLAADFLKVPYIYLSQVSIPVHLLQIIPEVVAKKEQIIAFEKNSQGLKVAMADPLNLEIQQFIAKKAGEKVIPYYATAKDLNEAMRLYSKELQKTFDEMLQQQVEAVEKGQAQDVPIAKIVDLLVEYAYQNKASDIHIEPAEQQSLVRFRIDGVLHDVLKMPIALHSQVVTRVKVLSKLRTDEHMSAQDGKLQMSLPEEELDIRVSIVPIVDGEKIVMRLLSSRSRQFSLGDLGMNDKDLAKVKAGFKRPYGMVLSTGPTGSGKPPPSMQF